MNLRIVSSVMLVAAALWSCAATASATVPTTAEGEIYTGAVKAEAEGSIALTGSITVTCGKSTIEGAIESHSSEAPAEGEVSSLTFSECGNHTVTVIDAGTLEVEATSEGDGTLTSTGAEITVLLHSAFLGTMHCIYVTEETEIGTLTGSNTSEEAATVDIESAPLPQSATDLGCGSESLLEGGYEVMTPATLAVFQRTTTLCKKQPKDKGGGKLECPAGESYGGDVIGELTGAGNLNGTEGGKPIGVITCEKIEMAGKFTSKGDANGGVSEFVLFTLNAGAKGPCSSTLAGKPAVTVSMLEPSYETSQFLYWAGAFGNGYLVMAKKAKKVIMSLTISGTACTYETGDGDGSVSGRIQNGEEKNTIPTIVKYEEVWFRQPGGKLPCPPLVQWEFKLKLLRPGNPKGDLYIASE